MSLSTSSAALPPSDAKARRGRWQALAIFAVCAAPTIAALLAYFFWQPQSRSNYGELIEPRPIANVRLARVDGTGFSFDMLKGKWVMTQIDAGRCDARCEAKLFAMRQVRLAQGRDMERIERVWLVQDSRPVPAALARLTDGVELVRISAPEAAAMFASTSDVRDHIYLIDPRGNVMLRFPANGDAKRMMKDIARLLKVSRIG